MAPTGLMDLPSELRLQILREVFESDGKYLRDRRFYLSGVPMLKKSCHALRVNRQIRREALTIFYGEPVWRVVNELVSWGISERTTAVLKKLLNSRELALIRRFRFEFDLDESRGGPTLISHVNAAFSGMTCCCDLLAKAESPLDLEIAWVDRCLSPTWGQTQAILQPLWRLSIRTITITGYWKCPRSLVSRPRPRTTREDMIWLESLAPSYQEFSQYLKSLTGITPIWPQSTVQTTQTTDLSTQTSHYTK